TIGHVTTGTNTFADTTWFNNPALNNHPEDLLFVQHVYNPSFATTNLYSPTTVLFYDNAQHQWGLFTEDRSDCRYGSSFFVVKPGADDVAYQHLANAQNNASGYMSLLVHPLLNGNPNAIILIQQVRGAGPTTVSQLNFAVSFNAAYNRWAI